MTIALDKQVLQPNTVVLDPELIIKLIEEGKIILDVNAYNVISLKYNPENLSLKQKAIVDAFIKVLNQEFGDLINSHGITSKFSSTRVEQDSRGNLILTFSLMDRNLYNTLIKRLNDKDLLPKAKVENTDNRVFNPSPFSTTLRPKGF